MAFADLKNDFVFRRIFATHPEILRRLLNDLLEREDERTIEAIEYLPSEQMPQVLGARLSVLDVRCKDRTGTKFFVAIQLTHFREFIRRVVYDACKADFSQLEQDQNYAAQADVVAISICEFELWPGAAQDSAGLPRVPMLSRWNMTEQSSNGHGLLRVQYAFLELPKGPEQRPVTGAGLWAWLFARAPELQQVPPELPKGPYRHALELADKGTFTQAEGDAYRKVMDEIQQVRDLAEAKWAEGFISGFAQRQAETLLTLFATRGIAVSDEVRARIEACTNLTTLGQWIARAASAASAEEVIASDTEPT